MPAYVIAQIEIRDPGEYRRYLAGFMPIFERYRGRLLATSACRAEVIEGAWEFPRLVVMEFPDFDTAKRWHDDPDYKALAEHRKRSAQANLIVVEGLDAAGPG